MRAAILFAAALGMDRRGDDQHRYWAPDDLFQRFQHLSTDDRTERTEPYGAYALASEYVPAYDAPPPEHSHHTAPDDLSQRFQYLSTDDRTERTEPYGAYAPPEHSHTGFQAQYEEARFSEEPHYHSPEYSHHAGFQQAQYEEARFSEEPHYPQPQEMRYLAPDFHHHTLVQHTDFLAPSNPTHCQPPTGSFIGIPEPPRIPKSSEILYKKVEEWLNAEAENLQDHAQEEIFELLRHGTRDVFQKNKVPPSALNMLLRSSKITELDGRAGQIALRLISEGNSPLYEEDEEGITSLALAERKGELVAEFILYRMEAQNNRKRNGASDTVYEQQPHELNCWAFALATALRAAYVRAKWNGVKHIPSPAATYLLERPDSEPLRNQLMEELKKRVLPAYQTYQGITGVQYTRKFIQRIGDEFGVHGKQIDINPGDEELFWRAIYPVLKIRPIVGIWGLSPTGEENLRAFLKNSCGGIVHEEIMDTIDEDDDDLIGHVMLINGLQDGGNLIEIKNSWGTAYGDCGYFYVTHNVAHRLFKHFFDITVMSYVAMKLPCAKGTYNSRESPFKNNLNVLDIRSRETCERAHLKIYGEYLEALPLTTHCERKHKCWRDQNGTLRWDIPNGGELSKYICSYIAEEMVEV